MLWLLANRISNTTFTTMNSTTFDQIRQSSDDYPKLLKQISGPPQTLYNRGNLRNDLFPIAVVGSRKMTAYGKQAAELLISGLRGLPISIVSGMAYGIDSQAHICAIKNNLHTVAVLGSGIDDQSIYPRANRNLAKDILENGGAIISEYPPGTPALHYNFPNRNRIISGMSKAVVVIEADSKSGSLITAKLANDQGRDIFAVPGSIFSKFSSGTNNLIAQGAKTLRGAADIIDEYPALKQFAAVQEKTAQANDKDLTPLQQKILGKISFEPTPFAEILSQTGIELSVLNSNIIMLEIKNKISACGDNCYIRNLTNSKLYG